MKPIIDYIVIVFAIIGFFLLLAILIFWLVFQTNKSSENCSNQIYSLQLSPDKQRYIEHIRRECSDGVVQHLLRVRYSGKQPANLDELVIYKNDLNNSNISDELIMPVIISWESKSSVVITHQKELNISNKDILNNIQIHGQLIEEN